MTTELNPKLECILGRRSIRSYEDKPLSDDQVTSLMQAGMAAPSACKRDPWHFVVVQEKASLARIAEGLPNGKMLGSSAVGIVVCGEQAKAHDGQLGYMLQDCSAAVENILLAVHALGLGACWLGVYPREDRVAHLRTVLGIPENITPLACISVGYPREPKQARSRYDAGLVHHEKW